VKANPFPADRLSARASSTVATGAARLLVISGTSSSHPSFSIARRSGAGMIAKPLSMPKLTKNEPLQRDVIKPAAEKLIRVRVRALEIPPIKDGLVIGRDAAIGGEAMLRTLRLMTHEKFDRIVLKDDIIQEIIVRSAVLRKLGRQRLTEFIITRIKPVMSDTELLMLDIEVELVLEDVI
jgi:hypothetical protein